MSTFAVAAGRKNHIHDTDQGILRQPVSFYGYQEWYCEKTKITDYENIRKTGLAAINLREDDRLIEVKLTDNSEDIILITKFGQCIRFHETDVRNTGRTSMGVIGMSLTDQDEVIAMQTLLLREIL